MIELSAKKRFLSWLVQSVTLKSRESYWIINYLINHELMLNKVMFVEDALFTPRGLVILDELEEGEGIEMRNQGTSIIDPNAVFHDIRMNRKETLYIEVKFKEMFKAKEYLSVIENNAYQPIDKELESDILVDLENYFTLEDIKYQLLELGKKIDFILENGNEKEFLKLSKQYTELKKAFISN